MTKELTIRAARPDDDYEAIEQLQRVAWNTDDLPVVPEHLLRIVNLHDVGLLALALHETTVVGYLLAFETTDKAVHHSHMMGVDPVWQSGAREVSVGMALKAFHRRQALARGIKVIQWTFDPLLGKNANLNLRKLRGRITGYERNAYGERDDEVYPGLPSDRVVLRWLITEEPDPPLDYDQALALPLVATAKEIGGRAFRLAIAYDWVGQDKVGPAEATTERLRVRAVFEAALAAGYVVKDFVTAKADRASYYVFTPTGEAR